MTVNIHQAKTHFSRPIERVAEGEQIVIAKAGKPVSRLVPIKPRSRGRVFGQDRGKFTGPETFNASLPKSVLRTLSSSSAAQSERSDLAPHRLELQSGPEVLGSPQRALGADEVLDAHHATTKAAQIEQKRPGKKSLQRADAADLAEDIQLTLVGDEIEIVPAEIGRRVC